MSTKVQGLLVSAVGYRADAQKLLVGAQNPHATVQDIQDQMRLVQEYILKAEVYEAEAQGHMFEDLRKKFEVQRKDLQEQKRQIQTIEKNSKMKKKKEMDGPFLTTPWYIFHSAIILLSVCLPVMFTSELIIGSESKGLKWIVLGTVSVTAVICYALYFIQPFIVSLNRKIGEMVPPQIAGTRGVFGVASIFLLASVDLGLGYLMEWIETTQGQQPRCPDRYKWFEMMWLGCVGCLWYSICRLFWVRDCGIFEALWAFSFLRHFLRVDKVVEGCSLDTSNLYTVQLISIPLFAWVTEILAYHNYQLRQQTSDAGAVVHSSSASHTREASATRGVPPSEDSSTPESQKLKRKSKMA